MTPEDAAAKSASQLTIITSSEGGSTTLRCVGKLIAGSTGILQREFRGLPAGSKRIVLDLTDLGYMDSTGLGSIIGLHVSAKSAGGRLEIINPNQRVSELFRITNAMKLFEVG